MGNEYNLEEELIKLKLEKRDLILAGKNTEKLDEAIKEVELKLKLKNQK